MKKALFAVICALFLFTACTNAPNTPPSHDTLNEGEMSVHFLDVGQADCQLILLPNGEVMMIDAGNNDDGDFICDYLDSLGISSIDHLVGTHPHEDHIGSLDTVIENYDVKAVYMPDAQTDTKSYYDVCVAIEDYAVPLILTDSETVIYSDDEMEIRAVAPVYYYEDLNNQSIVIRLVYKDSSFLFTGDAEAQSEYDIYHDIEADVLSVGHHGSSTSTSDYFLEMVDPMYAVISCGTDNDYGHPHYETLEKLEDADITIYRTDEDGTIICTTTGGGPADYKWEMLQ